MTTAKSVGLWICIALTAACSVPGVVSDDDDGPSAYAPASFGDGLVATYYDNIDLTAPVVERVDPEVDFDWGRNGPAGVSADTFSVRWTGFVEARYSETYEVYVTSDDGARLEVDGRVLVDEWRNHGPQTYSGNVALEAGVRYPIELRYYEDRGGAMVRLEWSSPSQGREVIPQSQLYTADVAAESALYEAEDRTAASGATERANHPGYTGRGFMDYGGEGTWVEWNDIRAAAAGTYTLRFRYANARSLDRRCAVIVNGSDVGAVPFGRTGADWSDWGDVAIDVPLRAGDNTIRVVATTSEGGPNLDHVETSGSAGGPGDDDPDAPDDPGPPPGDGPLDRASDAALRIGSWNVHRGSVFPKTDRIWRTINNSGKYHVLRTDGGARVFQAVDADIWLLQETVYTGSDLPDDVTLGDINRRLRDYMRDVTGDSWEVRCNGRGLCTMLRGGIRFDQTWNRGSRVAGHRVILPDGTRLLLLNGHYMNLSHAQSTRDLVESIGPSVAAVFVAGDFNDAPGGARYNEIDSIPGMTNLSIAHWQDPAATHVSAAMASRVHDNTKGYVKYGGGAAGQDVVTSISGGHIDHFFLKSSSWQAGERLVLNTLLFAPETLARYGMTPLDVALQPQYYVAYFDDFLSDGVVSEIPDGAYDSSRGIDHDHLPMVVDLRR